MTWLSKQELGVVRVYLGIDSFTLFIFIIMSFRNMYQLKCSKLFLCQRPVCVVAVVYQPTISCHITALQSPFYLSWLSIISNFFLVLCFLCKINSARILALRQMGVRKVQISFSQIFQRQFHGQNFSLLETVNV